jgi:hypothetical protein
VKLSRFAAEGVILNTKLVFAAAAVVAMVGALNITGMLGLPANSAFVHVEGYFMVILLIAFT